MSDNKEAVILNYSLLCSEVTGAVVEKVGFISRFFSEEPGLSSDPDLLAISVEFKNFAEALKKLDTVVNKAGEKRLRGAK